MPKRKKNYWKKQLHTWHWISSAISLICMILFSITGITLNHAKYFESEANETSIEIILPQNILESINRHPKSKRTTLPIDLSDWINDHIDDSLNTAKLKPEWNDYEIYIQKPIAGGDIWLSIDLESGDLVYMHTKRGTIAWLNDLHKGRNTSLAWIWFIDIFAIATLVFCITGLILLQLHSKKRPSTWYITSAGVVIPAILLIFI